MSETVIQVNNLSKQYRIGAREGYKTFRESLADAARAPFQGIAKVFYPQSATRNPQSNTIWALKDVSFEVKEGEVMGIIGRNGAGKSTLLKILSQITEPTKGRVELRGRVGSLLEVGTGFHPELTGHENTYLYGAILGMDRREVTRKFDEIVAFAEIEKFVDTPVKRYSSGMYMRLAFAVAAHLETEILLVDEVLAVGDTDFQKKCLGKMGDVAHEGRTVLFVSHNMTTIQTLCGRCLLLRGGRIASDGISSQVVAEYLHTGAGSGEVIFGAETERSGTGKAQYKVARLLDGQNQVISSIPMGQDLKVELHFEIHQDKLTSPSFGVVMRNALRQPIMRFITRECHGKMPQALKGGTVLLHIDRLDLLPSVYYLSLGLSNKGEQLDLIEDAIQLEVTPFPIYPTGKLPPTQRGYFMFAPCSWRYEYS
jgi:lipopolysaccharide transport system ATP-binding protein